ncbi:MAG TPA: hypothetical protein PK890_10280, partial [Terrimesophilobacter sp.]|nr:hypothetical protein [Terrimesophilobacter sp.]
ARVRQRAEDPEGYREGKKRRNDAWRASHRDHVNAKARAKRQRDPAAKQVAAQKYYDTHAEERRAYSRRYHRDNRDQQLAQQSRWRQREQRRLEAGLPVRRLHRLTPAERDAHAAAAAEFFSTRVIEPMRRRLRAELDGPTPPELLAAWKRECERYRAAHYASEHPETSSRERRRAQAEARRLAEEARLDTIGRAINDRLRISPRRREPDPAYLPQTTSPSTGPGMSL